MAEPREGRKALIIEDEPDFVDILRKICEGEGLEADAATEGARALDLLRRRRYEVVIVDLQLPGLDGLSFIDYAKEIAPEIVERVILFTGFSHVARAFAPGIPTIPKSDLASLRYALRQILASAGRAN